MKWAFYLGAAVFISAVLWTVISTREYSPAELEEFSGTPRRRTRLPRRRAAPPLSCLGPGLDAGRTGSRLAIAYSGWDKQLYVLGIGAVVFGVLQLMTGRLQSRGRTAACCTAS